MEEKLIEIAAMMDKFSKEYGYRIDVETFERKYINTGETRIIYNLKAVIPEETVTEVIS